MEDKDMKAKLTELVFILDRSGSMAGLESDTIGGFNAMLKKQKETEGEAVVTTVLFDDQYELLHDRIDIKGIQPITENEYFVRGSTALLDAVGRTISRIVNIHRHTDQEHRAEKVLFVITTDGLENASREFDFDKIRRMIEKQKNEYGWEFIFLGANMDAVAVAARFGIGENRAVNFVSDSKGTTLNYKVMSETISRFRSCADIDDGWKEEIEKDYRHRKGNK
jgi:uncharacterized protein YegL